METSTEVPRPHPPPPQRLRTFLRQNSQQFGLIAETVALPKNQRSLKARPPGHEVIPLDVESGGGAVGEGVSREPPPKQFPVFMLSVSFLQAVLFYYGGEHVWLLFGYDPFRRHELWRFLTISLVHSSGLHLWGNVGFQVILGCILEVVHHWKRISILYVAGVLGGSLAVTILDPLDYGVGASAGVYALLTAHLATIIMNWNEMDNKCCRLFWLLLYISFDVGLNAYMELVEKKDTNTSHAGHFGGAVVGFIVAVFVLRNFEKLPWERRFQKILAILLCVLFGVVVVVNVAWPSHYRQSVWNTNYVDTYTHYIIQTIHESDPDSDLRQLCLKDEECRELLQEHADNVNKAIEMEHNNN